MEFSKKYLLKYGWEEGQGLGKTKNGIKEAVKARLKFDKAGMGYEPGLEFSDKWWEIVYNDALNSRTCSLKEKTIFEPTNSNAASIISNDKDRLKVESDLYEACEGRTAHKGARHGLQLSGKLLRIAQQEKQLLASPRALVEAKPTETELQLTKIVKKKRKHMSSDQSDVAHVSSHSVCEQPSEIVRKKKKRKSKLKESEISL